VGHEAILVQDGAVHQWRVQQLKRLGIPGLYAEIYADSVDWHQIARLVKGGCPPMLAIWIVR
jgi:hypothetical protein